MSRSKRNVLLSVLVRLGVCTFALALAVLVFIMLVQTAPQPAASESGGELRRVSVLAARPVSVRRQWQGFGTALPMDEAEIPARVGATVIELKREIVSGAAVDAGQVIVRLDPGDFQRKVEIAAQNIADLDAQIERLDLEERTWSERVELAEEDSQIARDDLERVQRAAAADAARQREVDTIRQALNRAIRDEVAAREEFDKIAIRRASLRALLESQKITKRQAEEDLERTTIRSPLTGVLASVNVNLGENVSPGERVARVVSLGRIEVPLRVPSSARSELSVGQHVRLRATGSIEATWDAAIARLSPIDDEQTRTMTVFAEVLQSPDETGILAPGRFVEGWISAAEAERHWVVPRRALQGDRIQVVDDGVIRSREVRVAYQFNGAVDDLSFLPDTQWVVLADPLEAGTQVVLSSSRSLTEGLKVTPVPADAAGPPSEAVTRRRSGEAGP